MTQIILSVRKQGPSAEDYSLAFEVPEVPKVGSYIAINRGGAIDALGDGVVVREVWWRLYHPKAHGSSSDEEPLGWVKEIFVECDPQIERSQQ